MKQIQRTDHSRTVLSKLVKRRQTQMLTVISTLRAAMTMKEEEIK